MKTLLFIILLRGPIFYENAPDSLPPTAELFTTLRAFHQESEAAAVSRVEVNDKTTWMNWMPSVGVTLGRPTIGFSLGQVAANIERRNSRLAEKTQILRGSNVAFKTDSFALVAIIERHAAAVASLNYLKIAESIENQKFEIQKEKWKNGTVSPLDWLNHQADNLRSGEPLRIKLEEIELLEIEARKVAKY